MTNFNSSADNSANSKIYQAEYEKELLMTAPSLSNAQSSKDASIPPKRRPTRGRASRQKNDPTSLNFETEILPNQREDKVVSCFNQKLKKFFDRIKGVIISNPGEGILETEKQKDIYLGDHYLKIYKECKSMIIEDNPMFEGKS